MSRRLKLHSKLKELLGNENVYYQAPANMKYPAIKYSKQKPNTRFANNKIYSNMECYQLIVIDKKPDNPVIDKLLELQYCTWNNHYVADNLNHDVLTIFI